MPSVPDVPIQPATKVCTKCRQEKPTTEFGADRLRWDGLFPQCKQCRVRHPELYDERHRNEALGLRRCSTCKCWLSTDMFYTNPSGAGGLHRHCKPCAIEHAKRDWRAHREARAEHQRLRRQETTEQRRKNWASWYANNQDRVIARRAEAREDRADDAASLTGQEWRAIIKRQGNACARCKRPFSLALPPTRDHIIPFSKGGRLVAENTAALCRPCNTSKGTKTIRYM